MDGTGGAQERSETRRLALAGYAPVAGLLLLSWVVYSLLALRSPLPAMWPDEFQYAHLARSLADGNGFIWRNKPISQPAALYIYALAPIWAAFKSTVSAYHVSKVFNALVLSAQVIPVYLLARPLLGRRLALAPAAMTVAGTWMVISAHIITEDLGIPLATTALCLTAMTLYRPSNRTGFLALAFALLAAWARIQLAVLIPAVALALVLDIVMRSRDDRRERLDVHLPYLTAAVAVSLAGLILVALAPSVTGGYSDIFGDRPSVGRAFAKTALEIGGLVTASGFVPVLLLAAASARRAAWNDSKLGPLLRVFWPAAIATCIQAGVFLAGVGTRRTGFWWGIERYVVYSLPLAFVGICVLARNRRLLDWRVLAGAAALGLLLLIHPDRSAVSEERAAWSTAYRLRPLTGEHTGLALALAAAAAVGIVAASRRFTDGRRTLAAVLAVTAVVLVVQDQASWHYLTNTTRTFRPSLPADLQWIDHNARGPVAVIDLTAADPTFDSLDFFNRQIAGAYGPPRGLGGREMNGKVCAWVVSADGTMEFQPGCANPHAFFVNDPSARLTWQNEVWSISNPRIGRVARLAPGPERLRSIVVLPCPRTTPTFSLTSTKVIPADAPLVCNSVLAAELWTQQGGSVSVRYQGGKVGRRVTVGGRSWQIPPRVVTNVSFPVPKGQYRFNVGQDWKLDVGNPRIMDVRLSSGGSSRSLIS